MKSYIGTKRVNAKPLNRQEYNDFRGWVLPSDENGKDRGYLVEYVDGGRANTDGYAGYVSWSPKEQFDNAYRKIDGLTFGEAVEALKIGYQMARSGWNGKGMHINMIPEALRMNAYFTIVSADGIANTWVPSISDCLADDWVMVQ